MRFDVSNLEELIEAVYLADDGDRIYIKTVTSISYKFLFQDRRITLLEVVDERQPKNVR